MEDHKINAHSNGATGGERDQIDFSFVTSSLATRERNALKALGIVSVQDFLQYDFQQLYSIRGYGETTVGRLQKLQKRIANFSHPRLEETVTTLQSSVEQLRLSTKELNALQLLGVATVEEFLNADLEEVFSIKGFGTRTYHLLEQSKKRVIREFADPPLTAGSSHKPFIERSVFSLPLNPREKGALVRLRILTLGDFVGCDFRQVGNIPNLGAGTLQSLLTKQIEVREKIIYERIDSDSEFSCDDEFSAFLLELSAAARETLWRIGVTRISELCHTNLTILKYTSFFIREAYDELSQIQKDFSPDATGSGISMNDFLASVPIEQLGATGVSLDFLRQNAINTLQDFLFFAIPKGSFALEQLQFEWRSRYAPIDFLRYVPAYFSIVFRLQKGKYQSNNVRLYSASSETVKDFISATFEDLVKFTGGDLSAVREIQSTQYELVACCRDFQQRIDIASITDERSQGWEQNISEESLGTLPFFDGKPSRGGATEHLHESFLPNVPLDNKIVRGSTLEILQKIGISTLGELLLVPQSHLLLIKHCSSEKISAVASKIRKLLFLPPPPPLDKATPETFLTSLLRGYVHSDRTIDVLLQRIKGKTLENIAEVYGLTRERIRQLEKKCKSPSGIIVARNSFAEVRALLELSLVKLGGFAHVKQVSSQLAKDNHWPEQSCSPLFVEFLLGRVSDTFVYHGNGYYSTLSYPCGKCGILASHISSIAGQINERLLTQHHLLSNLLNSCCLECLDLPQRIAESFVDWKCSSDSQWRRILGEEEIYRSSKRSVQKVVYHILKKSSHPLDVKELLTAAKHYAEEIDEFTERQIKTAAGNLSASSKDIYFWDRGGVFVHRKNIPINKPIFALIEERLKQLIRKAKAPYIALYSLFDEYRSECEAEGIPSAHALHACLKARDIPGVAFMKSPCVSVSDEKRERRNVELLEDWVAQKKDIVSTNSLKRYAKEVGINSHRYSSTFVNLKSLVRYGTGLVVHLSSIGWDQEKFSLVVEQARCHWERCFSRCSVCAFTDELLSECEYELPELTNAIPWTSSLLFSFLSTSNSIVTFGNTYLAYGIKDFELAPQNLGDIVVEILKRKYGGGTGMAEISNYFRDELRILKRQLTPKMIENHPGLVITRHEIYLKGGKNAS